MHPWVSQAVAIGDNQKYLVALLTLCPEHQEEVQRALNLADDADHSVDLSVLKAMQEHVDNVNEGLARVETIKSFRLLSQDFTVESGEMTLSMKVKRARVLENHAPLIRDMYGEHYLEI